MVPVPEELETVKRILTLWRRGQSYRSIAGQLNANGVKTKRGRRWHHSTVAKVVQRRDQYSTLLKGS